MPPPAVPNAGRVAADRAVGHGQVFALRDRSAVAVHVAAGERQAADRNVDVALALLPSSMLNTRLPSPLFTSGVGSLPLASIVSRFAPGR